VTRVAPVAPDEHEPSDDAGPGNDDNGAMAVDARATE
jgi:putative alpha-1,2-mannosidase